MFFFFQAEDGIRDDLVTGVQTCALPISKRREGDHQGAGRMKPLLSVRDLRVFLDTASGPLSIVDGVSFEIAAGQVFGLAGESGSGKTITALALLGLLPAGARAGGSASLDGPDPLPMGNRLRRRTRRPRGPM